MQLTVFIPDLLITAYKAGQAILEVYEHAFEVTYKDDRSPLTAADRASNSVILSGLSEGAFGRFPVLSEEGKSIPYEKRKQWEYYWLVDPLDGTKEFIKRNGEFTVNIALIRENRPVLGVIYIPVQGIFYYAGEGFGSYKIPYSEVSKVLQTPGPKKDLLPVIMEKSTRNSAPNAGGASVASLTVIGSSSHATKEQTEFVESLKRKVGAVSVVAAGSSLKFCYVAEGRADIYPRFGPTMEWDTAAGQAIVEQAGGHVIDVETRVPLKYNKENLLNPWFIVMNDRASFALEMIKESDSR